MSRLRRHPPAAWFLWILTARLAADTTIDAGAKHAWAANTGWLDFAADTTHGVVIGGSFVSGQAWAANTGWIHFGDGSPVNGHSYANDSAADSGVNHDGAGNLSGYAWAANTGWIHFGWASAADPVRPRFDLQSGVFSGYAWSANTGWINLGTGLLATASIRLPDSDTDGIPDYWESLHFGESGTSGGDSDGDGVSDLDEFTANTDPNDAASYFRILSQEFDGAFTEVTVVFSSNPTRLYRLEFSNDLGAGGPWTDSAHGVFPAEAGTSTTKVVVFPGNPAKFFRAVAILPLSP